MDYHAFCSTEILFNTKHQLAETLLALKGHLLLVLSKSAAKRWHLTDWISQLQEVAVLNNSDFAWVNNIAENPTQNDLASVLEQIGDKQIDTIVAIGGGSVIDLAKGISAFYNGKCNTSNTILDAIKTKAYQNNQFLDIVAVPTTAGTGSEVTQWATIWDLDNKIKYSIDAPGLQPKKAIIVPELLLSTPALITLSTGLDAMCQAIEAYWSKHTNPLIQEIAYRAVKLLMENLRQAIDVPHDLKTRENLCIGSALSGIAFAKTRTTACHSISYPLTMFFNIPHGLAASITLDGVAKKNSGHFPNDQKLLALFESAGGIGEWISSTSSGVINFKLSEFGVKMKDLETIVANAFTTGRMDNNPVVLTKEDVEEILLAVL